MGGQTGPEPRPHTFEESEMNPGIYVNYQGDPCLSAGGRRLTSVEMAECVIAGHLSIVVKDGRSHWVVKG
jgi:hypothetical protein